MSDDHVREQIDQLVSDSLHARTRLAARVIELLQATEPGTALHDYLLWVELEYVLCQKEEA